MPTLSAQQIAQVAANAGLSGNALVISVAVALAESSGDTEATNHNTNGSTDYGLWQINSVHSQYNPAQLMSDPNYNAQAMMAISNNGTNWQPWSTYNSGAYLKYMPTATLAASGVTSGATVGTGTDSSGTDATLTGVTSDASDVVKFIKDLTTPALWERIAFGLAGAILTFAFVTTIKGVDPVKTAKKVAKTASEASVVLA